VNCAVEWAGSMFQVEVWAVAATKAEALAAIARLRTQKSHCVFPTYKCTCFRQITPSWIRSKKAQHNWGGSSSMKIGRQKMQKDEQSRRDCSPDPIAPE